MKKIWLYVTIIVVLSIGITPLIVKNYTDKKYFDT